MAETPSEISRLEGHKVIIFARNVDLVGQQKQNRLVNHVNADMNFTESGDRFTDELMGTSDPREVTADVRPTVGGNVDKFRRLGFFKTYEDGNWVGTRERAEQLVDPTNPVVMAMGAGRERRRDETVAKAMYDPAYQYDKDGDPVTKNFPSTQVIAVNDWSFYKGKADGGTAPSGDSPLTVPKLRKARVIASKAQLMGRWCIGVEEEDLQNLLTSVEVSSQDYNPIRALVDGERNEFGGFTFVRGEAGVWKYNATSTTATLPFWNEENILYKERPLVGMRVQEMAHMSYRWHAYYEAQDGWLRREDKGVGHILCKR